jgi:outer membrane protein OmpA-like peptidoglycan-associated protein
MKFNTQILSKFIQTTSLLIAIFFALPSQAQYVSPVYTVDSDYDGVPNVRDKCPTTPELIENFELAKAVTVKGKKVVVVFRNVRKNFEMRRRKLLIKKSRLLKQMRKVEEATKADILTKIKALDSLIKRPSIYEASVKINGKVETFTIPIDVDEFGCLPDADGDGIPDIVDKCPDKAGTKKLKGCPPEKKKDRDGDGITDDEDLCPEKPGPKKNKGCPEILKKEEEEILKKASKVLFEFSKADIKPVSFPILDEVVRLLQKYPKSNIHLEGHTDNVGKDQSNLVLSKNRAASVRKYFITKGIGANRITSIGYGEQRPIDTNTTAKGRQNNRRVDMVMFFGKRTTKIIKKN